jgi:hypothetical protein
MHTDYDEPAAAGATPQLAGLHASAVSSPGPLQPDDLIAYLQRTQLSCTQGYDVVSILAADRVNELFGQQYVDRVANGEAFAPVSGRVALGGNLYASFSGITLGQPLISFSPGAEPQDANLRIEFLSGTVTTEQIVDGITTVTSTQHIQPGGGFVLTGIVPLADVRGEADPNTHEVRIDIANGSDFAAHMNIPGAAAHTVLGEYFLQLMQQNASSWAYVLGSLNYSADASTKLIPTSFEIATQVDTADPADKGRVLLFITTAYGTAPAGRPAAMGLPNMVPAGSTTTLILGNRPLMGGLIRDAVQATLGQFGGATSVQPTDPNLPWPLYTVMAAAGGVNLGPIDTSKSGDLDTYYSGTIQKNNGVETIKPSDVVVPLKGLSLAVAGGMVSTTAQPQLQWVQPWVGIIHFMKTTDWEQGTITANAGVTSQQTAKIDAAGTVNFSGPSSVTVSVSSEGYKNLIGELSANHVSNLVVRKFQPALQQILTIQLPAVQTFAVNNLLFPADHNLTFASAYVPGDLVAFGDLKTSAVAVAPLYATLTPGQTCRFSASGASAPDLHWTLGLDGNGSITADGTYQAPDVITGTTYDVVTASTTAGGTRQTSSAIVTIVPDGLTVSPDYALMTPGATAQQFVASAAGGIAADISWSLVESNAPGTLTDGLYTPPAQLTGMQAVTVRATRTSDGTTADALVILASYPPEGAQVSGPAGAGPLPAGQSRQFTAPPGAKWSVLPAIGAITADGQYTAPQAVTAPTTVAVVATVYAPYVWGVVPVRVVPVPPQTGSD